MSGLTESGRLAAICRLSQKSDPGDCGHSPNGIYGMSMAGSLRLDVRELHHLAPFLGFLGDQLAELDRRSWQGRTAEVSEAGLHLRVVESRVDLLVELLDDLGRRGLRCADAEPA